MAICALRVRAGGIMGLRKSNLNKLTALLRQNKDRILKCWLEKVFSTYHADSITFFQTQKDRFDNPLGVTTTEAIISLYDEITGGCSIESDAVTSCLDKIIRIRAVQDLPCEAALEFIFHLKYVIRKTLCHEIARHDLGESLSSFEATIDALALRAFAVYASVREELHQIRMNEYKRMYGRFLERYQKTEIQTGPEIGTYTDVTADILGKSK